MLFCSVAHKTITTIQDLTIHLGWFWNRVLPNPETVASIKIPNIKNSSGAKMPKQSGKRIFIPPNVTCNMHLEDYNRMIGLHLEIGTCAMAWRKKSLSTCHRCLLWSTAQTINLIYDDCKCKPPFKPNSAFLKYIAIHYFTPNSALRKYITVFQYFNLSSTLLSI